MTTRACICAALETLNLAQNHVTDASLVTLLAIPHIRTLNLANTQVTASGLQRHLPALRRLHSLALCGCEVHAAACKRIRLACPELVMVGVDHAKR